MNSRQRHSSNGKQLVLFLVGLSLLAAVGTCWNYSRHVFSTHQAVVIDADGHIRASFPLSAIARLHPKQYAKITMSGLSTEPLRAQVVTVEREAVLLQLLEKPKVFSPGEACDVTIDTTISTDFLP